VSRSPALLARSLAFNALFYAAMIVLMIVALPVLALPRRVHLHFVRAYSRTSLWLLQTICGTKVEWRGVEKIPQGACIVACKHQSLWETFSLYAILDDPTYILKRELMWIPLFGWHMRKAGLIPIDRSAGISALSRMTARARKELGRSRQVVIFPEGTRRPPGAEPSYKPGVAHLYARRASPACRLRLIPDCSGRAVRCCAIRAPFWSKRSTRSRQGSTRAASSRSWKTCWKTRRRG